jgi:sulfite exporter TauE/SafE
MNKKKELKTVLRLTDEMILIQGIVLIEQGIRLMQWNNPEQLKQHLEALESIVHEILKECTQTQTTETLYLELSGAMLGTLFYPKPSITYNAYLCFCRAI